MSPSRSREDRRPKLAVWKFASCDGCQLMLLNCKQELLALTDVFEIAYFPEASRAYQPGPYDISLVEGSITTREDASRIAKIRRQSRILVAIGACATAGGIQALRNFDRVADMARKVYPEPDRIPVLEKSTPIRNHVFVDHELRGCPIAKEQLLELIGALLAGRKPQVPTYSVCEECKRAGQVCLLVSEGAPCLGPVTQAGCGALCPRYRRACYGCFGPSDNANPSQMVAILRAQGRPDADIVRMFRNINAYAGPFREGARVGEVPSPSAGESREP